MKKQSNPIIYSRNPIYVFYAMGAFLLFFLTELIATNVSVGPLEVLIFNIVSHLPSLLTPLFGTALFLGSLSFALLLSLFFLFTKRRSIAFRLATSATLAAILSVILQNWVKSSRSGIEITNNLSHFEFTNFDFPSIYASVATATALTLALYVSRSRRKWLVFGLFTVFISGIYLEFNLPIDMVGGYAVGLFSFSLVSLLFGSVYHPVDIKELEMKLRQGGLSGLVLKPAKVDARGSVPFFGKYDKGPVFVKVFNQDNNAADWLFKISRRILYNRLEDETPSFTPKRTIEHEAFLTILAKNSAGVRAPELLGVYRIKHNNYALATNRIDAKGLDRLNKSQVTDKMLTDTWKQIKLLHDNRIIHKDLRTANIMIENSTKLPWIIDFGFSEQAAEKKSFYKDNVEFLASSASIVGPKRAVSAMKKVMGLPAIKDALPYMQYAALSGATTSYLKNYKGLIDDIRLEMVTQSKTDNHKISKVKIKKFSRK